MDEQPMFRPAEQVGTPLRRAVMEPQAAPLWGGDEDVIPVERVGERVMPSQMGEPFVTPVERVGERVMPSQMGEPFVTPVERVGERVMPKQAGEPLLMPAEQSSERLMPRQMHTMAGEDPFGTVTEARSAAAGAPAGTFPVMQAGVPAGEGATAALKVGGQSPDGTVPAMRAEPLAGEGVTPALKVGGESPDGTSPALKVGGESPDGTSPALKMGGHSPDGTSPAMQAGAPAGDGLTAALKVGGDKVMAKQAGSSPSGGTGAGFVAIPEQYRAAAGPVLGVADQLKEMYTSLSGYMVGMHGNSPWGNDDDGKSFANGEDGEPGYLGNAKDVLEALKSLPEVVERIGKVLKGMGDGYDNAEEVSHSGIGQYDPALPPPERSTVTAPSTVRPGRH